MINDARQLPPNFTIRCDICIVGSGFAGIALAHELRDSAKDVVVLESGGNRVESRIQDLYKGEVVNPSTHGPLHLYRKRRFGGTTTWGGRCAPFEDIDFEARPYVPYSGWPICKSDLDPYYVRAHEYCDLGAYSYEVRTSLPNQPVAMIPGFESEDVCTDRLWRFSLPTVFSKAFGSALRQARSLKVYLHANCLRIVPQTNGRSVDHLEVASSKNKRFTVIAKQFVLATGGLEAARLLLVSDSVHPEGIGNERGLLGRFYMSHITGDLGEVLFTPKGAGLVWNYERTPDNVYCRRAIAIKEERQRQDQLLNFRAILDHPPAADPRHGSSILSSLYLSKRYLAHRIPPEYSRALSGMAPLQQVSAHCTNIVKDFGNLTKFLNIWVRKRIFSKRKLPSVTLENKSNIYTLHFDGEQSPNPESRVTLSDKRDAFGIRRLKVDWRCNDTDVQSVVRSCRLISSGLEQSGTGKMLFEPELLADRIRSMCTVGSHQNGTTRMASTPSQGVVDENCRVHGIENLYVASSSVFATSGVANPTLTIVALAIRLADYLRTV